MEFVITYSVGFAPLTKPGTESFTKMGIPELTGELFNPASFLAACDPRLGKYLTCGALINSRL